MKVRTYSIVIVLVLTLTSCDRRSLTSHSTTAEPGFMPQIRSFLISGAAHASFVSGLSGTSGRLTITTDGGQSWRVIEPDTQVGSIECGTLLESGKGWAINRLGQVFSTDDQGSTWHKIADPSVSSDSGESLTGANQIRFVNETDGWASTGISIWHTNNGGNSWHEVLSTLTRGVKGTPIALYPIDGNVLFIAGSGGQLYSTEDGGESWRIQTLVPDGGDFTDVWFSDKQNGWLTGYVGEPSSRPLLFATSDGGTSWQEMPLYDRSISPRTICFVDGQGWLAGYRRLSDGKIIRLQAVLLNTKDNGRSWTSVELGSNELFFHLVRFSDGQNGWLAGRDNLYRTVNGGRTWQKVLSLRRDLISL